MCRYVQFNLLFFRASYRFMKIAEKNLVSFVIIPSVFDLLSQTTFENIIINFCTHILPLPTPRRVDFHKHHVYSILLILIILQWACNAYVLAPDIPLQRTYIQVRVKIPFFSAAHFVIVYDIRYAGACRRLTAKLLCGRG